MALLLKLRFEVQQYFFELLLGTSKALSQTLEEMIEDMDSRSLTSVLHAIADNLSPRTSEWGNGSEASTKCHVTSRNVVL